MLLTHAYAALSTVAGNCTDGDLRLAEGINDTETNTMTGRVELCLNNAWGTICNSDFTIPDALVACNQLVGYQREGALRILGFVGQGLICCSFFCFRC